jgi:RNA polymerase II subunit A C-terminal domain phosphatase SSU72
LKKAIDKMDGTNGTEAAAVAAPAQVETQPENQNGEQKDDGGFKLKFCTVCASNQNR